ncbi:UNVERIFIED_ORG: outer membrane autotransporter protein [Stenotrophomonas geniculata]
MNTIRRATALLFVPANLASLWLATGAAQASCPLQGDTHVCSGNDTTARNRLLTSSPSQPDLNVVTEANYSRRNTNAVSPQDNALRFEVRPGQGGLRFIHDSAAVISGAGKGLVVSNLGRGDTDLALSGTISTDTDWAALVDAGASTSEMRISQPTGTIEGAGGLSATFSGRGDLDITSAGRIIGNTASGLLLFSRPATGDLRLRQAATGTVRSNSPTADAVKVTHDGRGELRLELGGTVESTGNSGRGVVLVNGSNSGAVTLLQGGDSSIGSASHAVVLENRGLGATSVDLEGRVASGTGNGVYAVSEELAAGLTIRAAGQINAATSGIVALNDAGASTTAAGETRIQVEGNVAGESRAGVLVNHSTSGKLTLQHAGGTVSAGIDGIHLVNTGAGTSHVDLHGRVDGGRYGVALHQEGAGNATMNQQTGTIVGRSAGLHLRQPGNGNAMVSSAGTIRGGEYGVALTLVGDAGESILDFNQAAGTIQGGEVGLIASNTGKNGMTRLRLDGAVVGGSDAAIVTTMNTRLEIGAGADIDGSTSGVAIRRQELVNTFDGGQLRAALHVFSAGTIVGDVALGLGNDVFTLTDGHYTGTVHGGRGGATASAEDGDAGGDDTFVWSGGDLVGGFSGQGGSDAARVSAAGYDGSQRLDGGDDTSVADGMIDTLSLRGVHARSPGSHLPNWEMVTLDASTLDISDGAWNVGMPEERTTGIWLQNGSTLMSGSVLKLGANLDISAGSRFHAQGAGLGILHVSGSVTNAGSISVGDGAAGDRLTIAGDYVGHNARLLLDTVLGADDSVTDRLQILGNASGTTRINIANVGGAGAATNEGIQVIKVAGHSAEQAFQLEGRLVAGTHEYVLSKGEGADGSWYLRSALADDTAAQPLQHEPVARPEPGAYLANSNATKEMFRFGYHHRHGGQNAGRAWARVDSARQQFDPAQGQLRVFAGFQAATVGIDVWQGRAGRSAGIALSTGRASSRSRNASTNYTARGAAVGRALTLHGTWRNTGSGDPYDGLYVDGSLQRASFRNRVDGMGLRSEGYESHVWRGAVETGYVFRFGSDERGAIHIEPQLQAGYSRWDNVRHTEANGTVVTGSDATSVFGRAGIRLSSVVRRLDGTAEVQPHISASWIRSERGEILMDGQAIGTNRSLSQRELNAGATVLFSSGVRVWGTLTLRDAASWSEAGAQMGVGYRW